MVWNVILVSWESSLDSWLLLIWLTVIFQSGLILAPRIVDRSEVQTVKEKGNAKKRWSRVSFGSPHSKQSWCSPQALVRSPVANLLWNANQRMKACRGIDWGNHTRLCQATYCLVILIIWHVFLEENRSSYLSKVCFQSTRSFPAFRVGVRLSLICLNISWRYWPRQRLIFHSIPSDASATFACLVTCSKRVPISPVIFINGPILSQLSYQKKYSCHL